MRKTKIVLKISLISLFFWVILSCDSKRDCSYKLKDERTLNEYYVLVDSCRLRDGKEYYEYYSSGGLVMSGFGDRLLKHGEWTFFHKNKKIASAEFSNGVPTGIWESDFVQIKRWKQKKSISGDFEISVPSSWYFDNPENSLKYSILTSPTKDRIRDVSLNVVVTNYDSLISDYIIDHNYSLKSLDNVKELEYKQLSVQGFDEAFQRKFRISNNGMETLVFQTFFGKKKKGKVFVVTQNVLYNSYRKYEPYLNSITNSIRIYD